MWVVTECETRNCVLICVSKGQEKETELTSKILFCSMLTSYCVFRLLGGKWTGCMQMMPPQRKIFILCNGENDIHSSEKEPEMLNFKLSWVGAAGYHALLHQARNKNHVSQWVPVTRQNNQDWGTQHCLAGSKVVRAGTNILNLMRIYWDISPWYVD